MNGWRRDRKLCRKARTFIPQRLFYDLHNDLLPHFEDLVVGGQFYHENPVNPSGQIARCSAAKHFQNRFVLGYARSPLHQPRTQRDRLIVDAQIRK